MAHRISGIITNFPYTGALPHIVLVGNYHFIPLEKRREPNYSDEEIPPYEELTSETRKILKELSFSGKCCYIETDYFGGEGAQMGETWQHGERISGPLVSIDTPNPDSDFPGAEIVENAINQNLAQIGIYCHEGMDEFDSVRLCWYRSNEAVRAEYSRSKH